MPRNSAFGLVFILSLCVSAVTDRVRAGEASIPASGPADFEGAALTADDIEAVSMYETEVRAQRPPLSAGSTDIDREEIAVHRPPSADEIVALVPGAKIAQHGAEGKGHQIFLQGFDAAHGSDVEASLMGVPLNEPSHVHGQGYLDLYGIIPEVVSKITVDKGPFLPDQGDFAMAGTLRFELSVPDSLRPGLLSSEVTHRGKVRLVGVVAPVDLDEETFAAVALVRDPGFGPDREAARASVLGQVRKAVGKGGAVSMLLSLQSARFESPETLRLSDVEAGDTDFWGAYSPAGHGLSDRVLLSVGYRLERDRITFDTRIFGWLRDFSLEENFTGRLFYREHGDLRRQAERGSAAGLSARVDKKLNVRFPLDLVLGLGWRFDHAVQKETQITASGAPWQTNRDLDFYIHQPYGFTGIRLSPCRFVTLFPSVRLVAVSDAVRDRQNDQRGNNTEIAALPRLAMSFPVHERVTVFADYGRGYRSPEARSAVALPTKEIEDERLSQYKGGAPAITVADSLEIGLRATPARMVELALSGFAIFIEREMVFDHVSNLNVAMDGTRRFGVTADVSLFVLSWLSMATDITFTDARFNRSKNRVPGVPLLMGAATVRAGRETKWYGGLALSWCTKRPLAHQATASGYTELGANAGYRFERVDVGVAVNNVLNAKNMGGVYHFASRFDDDEPRSLIPAIHYAAGEPVTARFFLTVFL